MTGPERARAGRLALPAPGDPRVEGRAGAPRRVRPRIPRMGPSRGEPDLRRPGLVQREPLPAEVKSCLHHALRGRLIALLLG